MQHISSTPEEWRPVVGYEGLYEVSSHGRVKSLPRTVVSKDGRVKHRRERMLKLRVSRSGHLDVLFQVDGVQKRWYVHRLVLDAFVGLCPAGMMTCHWDDDPANNNVSNLRWGTSSDNHLDRVRNGIHNNAKKTHCKRGHLLAFPNLRHADIEKFGRVCLACVRASEKARYRLDLKDDFQTLADSYYQKIIGAIT